MKKIALIVLAAVFVVVSFACYESNDCFCFLEKNGEVISSQDNVVKSEGVKECHEMNYKVENNGVVTEMRCSANV